MKESVDQTLEIIFLIDTLCPSVEKLDEPCTLVSTHHLIFAALILRSIDGYYQEHFGEKQRGYREWKLSQLNNIHFSTKENYLKYMTHPYFTKLHASNRQIQ